MVFLQRLFSQVFLRVFPGVELRKLDSIPLHSPWFQSTFYRQYLINFQVQLFLQNFNQENPTNQEKNGKFHFKNSRETFLEIKNKIKASSKTFQTIKTKITLSAFFLAVDSVSNNRQQSVAQLLNNDLDVKSQFPRHRMQAAKFNY